MPDFNKLLDADPTSFERPPTVPEGDFLLLIKGRSYGQSAQKKTPYVRFEYQFIAPMESVPEEALAGIDLSRAKPRDDFYLTEDAMYRLTEFLEILGCIQPSMRDSIDAAVGQQVIATFGHTTSQKDPSKTYSEIRSYTRAEV